MKDFIAKYENIIVDAPTGVDSLGSLVSFSLYFQSLSEVGLLASTYRRLRVKPSNGLLGHMETWTGNQ